MRNNFENTLSLPRIGIQGIYDYIIYIKRIYKKQ